MRRTLYANEEPETFEAPQLTETPRVDTPLPAEGWAPPPAPLPRKKKKISYAALFLGVAALFFVIAASAAAYFLIQGGRSVSTDRIIVTPDGPTTLGSGDTLTLLISIENQNPVAARETTLFVDFPETSRSPENEAEAFVHYEDTVGEIAAGATGTRSVQVVLFGAENERILIPIRFEYRTEGSNAVYVKEAEYEVVITSSPISVRAVAISEVAVGQPLTFAVTVRSNANTPIENVAVLAQYPFGYTPRGGEGPVFPVGTLAPGEEKTIPVTGVLTGENDDERVFRFTAGTRRGEDTNVLLVSYATAPVTVGLKKPFLAVNLSVNRDTGSTPVVSAGEQVQSIISWANTLSGSLLDARVEVKLSGVALDTQSISAYGGFYRSSDSTIIYSKESAGALGNLAPGATGSGSFSFMTKSNAELAALKNPTIVATVSVAGRRVDERNVPESVPSVLVRTIKVGTQLGIKGGSRYTTGPFTNTGPWPPIADQETTYTVDMDLTNSVNSVADAVVTGTLPSYVRYVQASDSSVSYNPTTRVITWKAGEVLAGAGYAQGPKRVSIQVVLLPSASQRGTSPILVSSLKASGVDRFTQRRLDTALPSITAQGLNDPSFDQGKGEVR
jgi:hypothetical protein